MSIKVISQNVMCWEKENIGTYAIRRPLLKKVFRDYDADIIGMQEVTNVWEKYFDKDLKGFKKLLVYRGKKNKEAVPIFWKDDKLEALDYGHFWLSETPDTESFGWNAACLRITCWILFKIKENGKTFAFVNTHLDHISEEARINGLKLIRSFIEKRFGKDTPLVLTGDFNALPDSETVKNANKLFNDARKVAKETTEEITFHGYSDSINQIIDYIYLSSDIKCDKFQVIKEFDGSNPQSDHYGLLAEINI